VVLHTDGDVVTGLQTAFSEEMGQPIRGCVEFGKGLCPAGPRHDHGGLVGVLGEVRSRVHAV
jgi:hypothetical protein